jgi:hypothetical protein
MRLPLLLLFLLAGHLTAQVELPDLRVQNAGGTVVQIYDVKLLHVDPDGLRVSHSVGSAKVPYELLPDELQARYGFNASNAKQYRETVAAAQQQSAAAAVSAEQQSAAAAMNVAETRSLAVLTAPLPASTYAAAIPRASLLDYATPTLRNTRTYSSSSRRRYSYSPSCSAYSAGSYFVNYYNNGGCYGCSSPRNSTLCTSSSGSRYSYAAPSSLTCRSSSSGRVYSYNSGSSSPRNSTGCSSSYAPSCRSFPTRALSTRVMIGTGWVNGTTYVR